MGFSTTGSVLVTGSSGYLGGLIAAALWNDLGSTLILPVRSKHTRESILASLEAELNASGRIVTDADRKRIVVVPLPPNESLDTLKPLFAEYGITEIVHCAGSVDYFDTETLKSANIELTEKLLDLGKQAGVERFVYLSTAFSCGYVSGKVSESLHDAPEADPTDYTWSKREAEAIVASSGLPYVIMRPSIVIGDSRDGRYHGKRYGIYQLWCAAERFLCDRYLPIIHAVAPKRRLHVVHQDAFQEGFLAAYHEPPPSSIIHLVSEEETLPTVRQLWDLWIERCARPREVHYFDRLDDVPTETLDRRQRAWVEFTSVNMDIATHFWRFETAGLDWLKEKGLKARDATIETVAVCLERFMNQSRRIQKFLADHCSEREVEPRVVETAANP